MPFRLPFAALAPAAPVRAADYADPLRIELAGLAESIRDVLAGEKESAAAVGDFTGPPKFDSASGPGIELMLTEELQRLGVTVDPKSGLSVSGSYADTIDDMSGDRLVRVTITARILSRNGDERTELSQRISPRTVRNTITIASVLGATARVSVVGDRVSRNEAAQKALIDPKAHVTGAVVSAEPGALFGVAVWVKADPRGETAARPPKVEDGQAVVAVGRDETYELRLHNRSAFEAAATVAIDGVDLFAFGKYRDATTGRPQFSHIVVVGPRATARVAG